MLRPALPSDAHALATVHVASWQRAYRGLLPDDYLDGLEVGGWRARWERSLAAADWPRRGTLVAETERGLAQGFVDVVPSRDDDAEPATAEVTSLYVLPDRWRAGVGTALMTAAVDALPTPGYRAVTLWVLSGNARARRFYERTGWAVDGAEKTAVVAGVPVTEARYRRPL